MRSYDNTRNLNTQIKAGLQVCHRVINKEKHIERKYILFNDLAELYLQKEKVRDYPKAVAIYQYLKKLVKKHLNNDQEKQVLLNRRIKAVELKFLRKVIVQKGDLKNKEEEITDIDGYVKELTEFREGIKKELAAIEDLGIEKDREELNEEGLQKRVQAVERIYMNIREFFIGKRNEAGELAQQGLLNKLIKDCIKQLGGLPRVGADKHECVFAVFGLGSMALGTMTPWSDMEFGILIESGLTKEEENRVKEYFRNLTSLLHIKVINFGETPLRMMGIEELNNFKLTEKSDPEHNWFYDNLTGCGFSFDGPHWHACKTPLGRDNGYKKVVTIEGVEVLVPCTSYELIRTVDEFNQFYMEKYWSKEDPQLVQGLKQVMLIGGNPNLIMEFQLELEKHKELIRLLAFKILKEDNMVLGPLKQVIDENKEGRILKVKKEIYRFPDRMIVALGDCLGGKGKSSWELINSIVKIESRSRRDIQLALSIATEIRLRTYANNGGQVDDMSAIARYESQINELRNEDISGSIFFLKDARMLYRYFFIVMELNIKMTGIKDLSLLESINKRIITKMEYALIRGYVYQRFSRYYDAIYELERAGCQGELQVSGTLASLYYKIGYYEKALKLYQEMILINEISSDEKDLMTTILLTNIGVIHDHLGNYKESLDYHKRGLGIKFKIFKATHSEIANAFNNIGLVLESLGRYNEALAYHQESISIQRIVHKGDHPDIAASLNNIGNIYGRFSNYEKALSYQRESLRMKRKIYRGDHFDIANSIYNIGATLYILGKYVDALHYYQESLEMQRRIYKGDHADIAASLHNIGITLSSLNQFKEALGYQQESLGMLRKIYGRDHTEIANLLNSVGNTFEKLGIYAEAIGYQQESLEMQRRIYKGDHADIANSLSCIGTTLQKLGRYEEVLKYQQESLVMRRRVYKGDHVDTANSLNDIGNVLQRLGRYEKALEYYQESIVMKQRIFNDDHASIAISLSNKGIVLDRLGRYEEALNCQKKGLDMLQRIYKEDHVDIANSLSCIGTTLLRLGRYEESFQLQLKSLEILRRIYKEDHLDIAGSLNNIGNILRRLGKYKEALDYQQESLEIRQRIHKGDHADIADSLNNIGITLGNLKRYEEALFYQQKSLDMRRNIYKGDHVDITNSLNNIGITLVNLGKYEEALCYQQESLVMIKRIYEGNHTDLGTLLLGISVTCQKLERWKEAYNHATKGYSILIKLLPSEHELLVQAKFELLKCTITLANEQILTNNMQAGLVYYYSIGVTLDNFVEKVYNIANQFLQVGEFRYSISCYEVLSRFLPQDRNLLHNLACMYHMRALKEKSQKKEEAFIKDLSKARAAFERAISEGLEEEIRSSMYVEYSQFLIKYHNKDNKEEYNLITRLLGRAVKSNDDSILKYNQLEKTTTCDPLQEQLSKQEEITIKPELLRSYLLVKIHTIHANIDFACKELEEFKRQLQILRTVHDCCIGYHLLSISHKEIIAAIIEEVSSVSTQSSKLPNYVYNLIGEYEGSLSYDRALSLNSEGVLYFRSKNYTTAIITFSKAVGLSFTNPISEVLYNRARAYHESSNYDEAILDYKESVRVNPNQIKAYYQLGICYKQSGHLLQAETYLRKALEKDPKLEIAQNALDEINKVISGNFVSKMEQQRAAQQQSYREH